MKIIEWLMDLFYRIGKFFGIGSSETATPGEEKKPFIRPRADERLTCPICLAQTAATPFPVFCDTCKKEIPPLYVEDHRNLPVLPVQVFGNSQHGKTVFLYSLTMMLKRLQRLWQDGGEGYTFLPVNQESRHRSQQIDGYLRGGAMPPATPLGVEDVYIALLQGMQRWGNRTIAIRDTAGEAFESMTVDTTAARFLPSASGVLMVLSLDRFEPGALAGIEDPFVSYVNTLIREKRSPRGKKVVIVLTKADLQLEILPASLRRYLKDDPMAFLAQPGSPSPSSTRPRFDGEGVAHYLEGMKLADQEIRKWLTDLGYGNGLGILAKRHGIQLRYSLVSATGGPVSDGDFPEFWSPKRVLDPFFWFLELS